MLLLSTFEIVNKHLRFLKHILEYYYHFDLIFQIQINDNSFEKEFITMQTNFIHLGSLKKVCNCREKGGIQLSKHY